MTFFHFRLTTSPQQSAASFYSSSTNLSHDPTRQATSLNSSRINSPFSSTQSIRDANITSAVSNNAVSSGSHLLQSTSNVSLTTTHTRHLPTTPNKLPSPQKPQQLPLQTSQARPADQDPSGPRQPSMGPNGQAPVSKPSSSPSQRPGPSSRAGDSAAGGPRPSAPRPKTAVAGSEDSEDTMKNLRKTFAGIFGDM